MQDSLHAERDRSLAGKDTWVKQTASTAEGLGNREGGIGQATRWGARKVEGGPIPLTSCPFLNVLMCYRSRKAILTRSLMR